jgi:hypothetical protein
MPIVKITGQGLSAIALSVALLWGCLLEERAITRHTYAERARVLQDLRRLRRTPQQPASAPLPQTQQVPRVTTG